MLYRRIDGSGYVSGAELMTFEPVALAAGSDDFIQDDEGVQEMRENPVIIKTCGLLLNNGLSQQAAHDTGKLYHSRVNFAMRIFSAGKEI